MPGPPEALSKCDMNYDTNTVSERVPRSHTPSSSPPNKREGVGGARRLEANTKSGFEFFSSCSFFLFIEYNILERAQVITAKFVNFHK